MTKILFLDVDGVLNTRRAYRDTFADALRSPDKNHELLWVLDPSCVSRLKRVLVATGARIVVSSVWRRVPAAMKVLEEAGIVTHRTRAPGCWRTPDLQTGLRGHDIQHWLDHNPGWTQYAIVDDDSDMLDHQRPYFVQTKHQFGLQQAQAEALMRVLNTPRKEPKL